MAAFATSVPIADSQKKFNICIGSKISFSDPNYRVGFDKHKRPTRCKIFKAQIPYYK